MIPFFLKDAEEARLLSQVLQFAGTYELGKTDEEAEKNEKLLRILRERFQHYMAGWAI